MGYLLNTAALLFEPGDRMSREEFLERWERMPELNNAELIDGVVYLPGPVSIVHGTFNGQFLFVLSYYAAHTPGCESLSKPTWMMLESAPQPDGAVCILPEYGGRMRELDGFAAGTPELATEVTPSSRSYDLGPKLALYQRAEVQEYVAALLEEKRIEWRVLENGSYLLISPDADGIFRSRIFPGLWVDNAAFWREDGAGLLAVMEQGLAADEHAKFVDALARRREALSRSGS